MFQKLFRALNFCAVFLSIACFDAPTQAAVVQLSFSGTYDTAGGTAFGLSGSAVPYSYQLIYDTSLNTSPWFFATGASLGTDVTTDEWFGYSGSGIVSSSLTFGTETWSASSLNPRIPAVGVSADIWFDTDISQAAPSLCWMEFSQGGTNLQIGGGAASSVEIFMSPISYIFDPSFPPGTYSSDMSIVVVPEPSAGLLGGVGLTFLLRRRARGK